MATLIYGSHSVSTQRCRLPPRGSSAKNTAPVTRKATMPEISKNISFLRSTCAAAAADLAIDLGRQPQTDLRESIKHDHRYEDDDHERQHAAENVVDVDPTGRDALEIERRHGDRRR